MVSYSKIKKINYSIFIIFLLWIIVMAEAKHENNEDDEKGDENGNGRGHGKGKHITDNNTSKKNSTETDKPIEDLKVVHQCNIDNKCTSFYDYTPEMAYCNKTINECENYCFIKTDCTNDFECNFSKGDRKKCGVECYKENKEDKLGKCLLVSKEGEYCNGSYIICGGDLLCDYYSSTCINKNDISGQSGEPIFSLFLFMIIMLSLFNKQRSDEELLNAMSPNELLMITFPNRRAPPEEDALPMYQPVNSDANADEVIESNLNSIEIPQNETENTSGILPNNTTTTTQLPNLINTTDSSLNQPPPPPPVVGEDGQYIEEGDLPLYPPTYEEAIQEESRSTSNINIVQHVEGEEVEEEDAQPSLSTQVNRPSSDTSEDQQPLLLNNQSSHHSTN